jgi:hypothetical protein
VPRSSRSTPSCARPPTASAPGSSTASSADRTPLASVRWAAKDPVVTRLLFDLACELGATVYVRDAARSELVAGRVEARADSEGRSGVLIAVQTSAPPDRTDVLCAEVCRRLLAGELLDLAGARLRGLGRGTELQGSYHFAVGT